MKRLTRRGCMAVAVLALVSACQTSQTFTPRRLSSYPDATAIAGQELVALLEGNTAHGVNDKPGDKYSPWIEYYEAGGTAYLKDPEGLVTGSWRVESDHLCLVYIDEPNKPYCYYHHRNGQEIFLTRYYPSGQEPSVTDLGDELNRIVGTIQVAPGDPEGLAQQQ